MAGKMNSKDIVRTGAQHWKSMLPEEKKPYQEAAAQAKKNQGNKRKSDGSRKTQGRKAEDVDPHSTISDFVENLCIHAHTCVRLLCKILARLVHWFQSQSHLSGTMPCHEACSANNLAKFEIFLCLNQGINCPEFFHTSTTFAVECNCSLEIPQKLLSLTLFGLKVPCKTCSGRFSPYFNHFLL